MNKSIKQKLKNIEKAEGISFDLEVLSSDNLMELDNSGTDITADPVLKTSYGYINREFDREIYYYKD